MRVKANIKPQWKKLSNWYWDSGHGMSIWEMLEREYGAFKTHDFDSAGWGVPVEFPNEKMYTAFLLKWS